MIEQTQGRFTRRLTIEGANDICNSKSDPKMGSQDVGVRFILLGDQGALSAFVHTRLFLYPTERIAAPFCSGVSIHAPSDEEFANDCDILPGGKCCGDNCSFDIDIFMRGDEAVWTELEKLYIQYFGEDE